MSNKDRVAPTMQCPLKMGLKEGDAARCEGSRCMWALVDRDMAGEICDVTCAVVEIGRSLSGRRVGSMGIRERGKR